MVEMTSAPTMTHGFAASSNFLITDLPVWAPSFKASTPTRPWLRLCQQPSPEVSPLTFRLTSRGLSSVLFLHFRALQSNPVAHSLRSSFIVFWVFLFSTIQHKLSAPQPPYAQLTTFLIFIVIFLVLRKHEQQQPHT